MVNTFKNDNFCLGPEFIAVYTICCSDNIQQCVGSGKDHAGSWTWSKLIPIRSLQNPFPIMDGRLLMALFQ